MLQKEQIWCDGVSAKNVNKNKIKIMKTEWESKAEKAK